MSQDEILLVLLTALHEETKKAFWADRSHCGRQYDKTACENSNCHDFTTGQCALQGNIDTLLKVYARMVGPFGQQITDKRLTV